MKQLNDLFLRDMFVFAPEAAEELVKELKIREGQRGNVFMVTMKYDRGRIRIGDTTTGKGRTTLKKRMTMEKIEVSGNLEIIPEKGNREGKIPSKEEAIRMIKNLEKGG